MMKHLLSSLLCLCIAQAAHGWGDEAHQAIWSLTQSRLSPAAKAEVDSILAGDKLDMTPVWMDRVRDVGKGRPGLLTNDADAIAFTKAFPNHATWHYVDLPLGAASYESSKDFHGAENIVQQIQLSIQVLRGQSQAMDRRTALRVVAHLVADIHQPMHCSSGFFDVTDLQKAVLRTNPAQCLELEKQHLGDRGGNALFYGPDKYNNLHGFWDFELAKMIAPLSNLKEVLAQMADTVPHATPGMVEQWPSRWADESLKLAAKAYADLSFGAVTLNTDPKKDFKIDRIAITFSPDYNDKYKQVVAKRMVQSALRLATLFNGLFREAK
jgi:hypothetical protein